MSRRSLSSLTPLVALAPLVVAACTPKMPARDAAQRGRFGEACRAVEARELGSDDLDQFGLADAIADRSPLTLSVRSLTAETVEQRTGLARHAALRRGPIDVATLPTHLRLTPVPPDPSFERDWVVLEVELALGVGAPAPAQLGDISLVMLRKNPAKGSTGYEPTLETTAVYKREALPDGGARDAAMLRALGLEQPAGSRSPSLWSMLDLTVVGLTVGIIDPKSRGASPLLLTERWPGRKASPDEIASTHALGELLGPPCDRVAPGGRCTQRVLLRRQGSAVANAVSLSIAWLTEGSSDGCRASSGFTVGLPPARSAPLAVTGAGLVGLTPSTLSARTRGPWRSTDCGATCDVACRDRIECLVDGRCEPAGEACRATAASCAESAGCAASGACFLEGTACVAHGISCALACATVGACEGEGASCRPTRPEHCAGSLACRRHGGCAIVGGACAPASDADCRGSEDCRRHGFCTRAGTACVAATDEGCAGSDACRLAGACRADGGVCVGR